MPMPWETTAPNTQGSPDKMPWETSPPGSAPDNPEAAKIARSLAASAPGIKTVQNPLDAFWSGIQTSAAGQIARSGKPADLSVPANASFMQKLSAAAGTEAGDFAFQVAGAIGGATAGAEAGPGGAVVGGGAGAFALPEAVRQAAQDVYMLNQKGRSVTASDFIHMVAHNSVEIGKQAAVGAVTGTAGKVAEVAAPLWKSAASLGGAFLGMTTANSVINQKLPDGDEMGINAIMALGFGAAAHVAAGGRVSLSPAGEQVERNLSEIHRQAGVMPHEAIVAASGDQKLEQELKTADVNGDPVLTKFNATRAPDDEPFERVKPKASPFVVARKMPDGTVQYGKPGDVHFNLLNEQELSAEGQPQGEMGFAEPGGEFKTREEAAAAIGQKGRLESMRSQGQAREGFGKRGEPIEAPEFDGSEAAIGRHVEQLLPQIRGLERSGDEAISPKGAVGRYQIEPGTARQYGFDPGKLTDPKYNEMVARTVLADLSRRFNGDTEAVLVAYNAGPGRAFRFLRDGRDTSKLPMETQRYLVRGGFGGKGGEPPEPPSRPPEPEGGEERPGSSAIAAADYDASLGEQEPPRQTGRGIMRQMVSELESARGIDRTLIRQGLLDPMKDISTEDMFRQTYASDDRASYMINKGNIDPVTFNEKEGPSLLDVMQDMKDAGGNIRDFNIYRIAQRTVDLSRRGEQFRQDALEAQRTVDRYREMRKAALKAGKDTEELDNAFRDAQKLADEAEEKSANHPSIDLGIMKPKDAQAVLDDPAYRKYEAINAKMQYWKRGGLEYGRDSGMFSQRQIDAMEAASSHVSIRRIMGDNDAFSPGNIGAGRGFRVSNPLQRMEGSDRQISDPLMADIDNLRQIVRMSDRNRAILHVMSIPSLVKALKIKVQEVPNATLAEPGSNVFRPYSMETEQENAFQHIASIAKPGDKNTFTFFRNGKKFIGTAEQPEVAELMRGADSKITDITANIMGHEIELTNLFGIPAALQRAGIVGAFDFPLRVFQKHGLTAAIMDPLHPPPVLTGLQGLTEAVVKGDKYWDLLRHGGHVGMETGTDAMVKDINRILGDQAVLQHTGALEKTWNVVSSPLHAMQLANEMFATAERIGYMDRGVRQLNMDPTKVATMGRKAFLDFQERAVNSAARLLAQRVPFFKSETLGLKYIRDGVEVPNNYKGKVVGAITAYAAFSAAMFALNKWTDQYIEDPTKRFSSRQQYMKDNYTNIPIGTDGTAIRLGTPYVIGPIINVPIQRALQRIWDNDPHAFDGMFQAMMSETVPGVLPPVIRAPLEQMTNHNFFTGQQLVSGHMQGLTADEQYTENTSEAAKKASALLSQHRGAGIAEVPPVVIDNYVRDWTGTWGMTILHAFDAISGKSNDLSDWKDMPFVKGFVIQNPRFNTKQVADFYTDAQEWQRLHADSVEEIKRGDPQGLADRTDEGHRSAIAVKFEAALNNARRAVNGMEQNKEMNKDEKRQIAAQIYQDAWHIATLGSAILAGKTQPDYGEIQNLNDKFTSDLEAANGNHQ